MFDFVIASTNLKERATYRNTIDKYHGYKKWTDVPGRRIGWNIYSDGRVIGAIGIASPPISIKPRDRFIGWNREQRMKHLNNIGNNYRFCMIERGLGSRVLGYWLPIVRREWYRKYGDPLFLIETMVQPPYTGTVYKASSWLYVGMTSGISFKRKMSRGLLRSALKTETGSHKKRAEEILSKGYETWGWKQVEVVPSVPKMVFVKPLVNDFKAKLCSSEPTPRGVIKDAN